MPQAPQIRALWIDAFSPDLKTQAEIDEFAATAHAAHINTLIPQARRRADAYFLSAIEPRTEDPAVAPGFDPLGYLLEKAHGCGMEVHAWGPVYPAWRWLDLRATRPIPGMCMGRSSRAVPTGRPIQHRRTTRQDAPDSRATA